MINPSNSILLFNDHVIDCSDKFILFGQYLEDHFSARDIKYQVIKNKLKETVSTRVILHRKRNDFYMVIFGVIKGLSMCILWSNWMCYIIFLKVKILICN